MSQMMIEAPNRSDESPLGVVPLSLRRNFSWTLVGNVIYAACQWGMLTVLAKLSTTEAVGQFALALALTAPIFMFTNLQLRGVQATDANGQYQFNDYLALRVVMTVGGVLALLGAVKAFHYSQQTVWVILVVGLGKALDALSDIIYGLFQQREQMDLIAKSMILNGLLSLIALSVGIVLTGDLALALAGSTLASLVTLVCYNLPWGARVMLGKRRLNLASIRLSDWLVLTPRWSPRRLYRLTGLALPLGIVMMLVSLNANVPRYFVDRALGAKDLGVYAALAYLLVAGTTVVTALGQSASPRLARHFILGQCAEFRHLMQKLILIALVVSAAGGVMASIVGRQLLTVIYTAEYAKQTNVFLILVFAGGLTFAASFLGYGMTAVREFRAQVPLFGAVLVAGITACGILVPRFGLTGAAIAVALAAMVQLVGSTVVVHRALQRVGNVR